MPSEVTLDQCVAKNTQNSSNLDALTLACTSMTGCRCQGPPAHTCVELGCTYPGVGTPSEVKLDQGVAQNSQNSSKLHKFTLAVDPDLAFFDRFQVPGATCSGGGHLLTPA